MGVTHFAFNFGLRHQCRHGINNHHIHRAGTHQHVSNFQCLLTGVRLGHDQVIHVHAQLLGIVRVQGVLCIHKGTGSAFLLRLGDHAQGQGGLTRGFRAIDFHDTPFRQTTNTKSNIQPQGAGGNGRHALALAIAHAHHGTFTKLTFDLG